jgi:hypothetical protein
MGPYQKGLCEKLLELSQDARDIARKLGEDGFTGYEIDLNNLCSTADSAAKEIESLDDTIADRNAEIDRLNNIEWLALACDGIDMGRHTHVPTDAWDELQKALNSNQ